MGSIYTQITKESGRTPSSLTRKIENGVNAIQKWAPFTPNCSQVPEALVAGAPPQTPPPIARESAFALASLTRWREGRQFPSSPQAPETLGTPLGLGSYEAESTKCSIYSLRCARVESGDWRCCKNIRHWIVRGGGATQQHLASGRPRWSYATVTMHSATVSHDLYSYLLFTNFHIFFLFQIVTLLFGTEVEIQLPLKRLINFQILYTSLP